MSIRQFPKISTLLFLGFLLPVGTHASPSDFVVKQTIRSCGASVKIPKFATVSIGMVDIDNTGGDKDYFTFVDPEENDFYDRFGYPEWHKLKMYHEPGEKLAAITSKCGPGLPDALHPRNMRAAERLSGELIIGRSGKTEKINVYLYEQKIFIHFGDLPPDRIAANPQPSVGSSATKEAAFIHAGHVHH